ncbi:DUF1353 domain-containing protein [Candidatus Sumerlaeota bacterium]|nr:DUF1353 domain-containing protein [Candidatus Sumerlaeota bacterium]
MKRFGWIALLIALVFSGCARQQNALVAYWIYDEAMELDPTIVTETRKVYTEYEAQLREQPTSATLGEPVIRNEFGAFYGQPEAVWEPDGVWMKLTRTVYYEDPSGVIWTAPRGTYVNGSSIPQGFWSTVGSPYRGRHRYASVFHDVACLLGPQPGRDWKTIHRMYYNACRCGGMPENEAKLLYTSVYHFGPPRFGGDFDAKQKLNLARNAEEYISEKDRSLEQLEQLPY